MLSTSPAFRRSAMICSRKPSGISARSAMTRTWTGWSGWPLMLRSSMALMPYSHLAEKIICGQSYPRLRSNARAAQDPNSRPPESEGLLEGAGRDLAEQLQPGRARGAAGGRSGLGLDAQRNLRLAQGVEAAAGLAGSIDRKHAGAPAQEEDGGRAVAQGQAERRSQRLQLQLR